MADKVKHDDKTAGKKVSAADLKRSIADVNKHKESASEYAGMAGKATQQAVDAYGLDKTAFGWTRKLASMEPAKRGATFASLIDYAEKMGFADPGMFDEDLVERLAGIVDRFRKNAAGVGEAKPAAKKSASDKKVDDVLTGGSMIQ